MPMEIITPRIRGFICTNAHPAGCAKNVEQQFQYVQKHKPQPELKINALIIGSSTGYGLSSRIACATAFQAQTLGVFFERLPEGNKIGSAGFYNSAAFHKQTKTMGLWAKSINGDAFSDEIKRQALEIIKNEMGKLDLVVYSLASPRRTHPKTGEVHNSILKPIGQPFTSKTIDLSSEKVMDITLQPATDKEIVDTIAVMGGEDWQMWMDILMEQNLLNSGIHTVAYSYIGPEVTWPIYRSGTIGKAKAHLELTAHKLNQVLQNKLGGNARVSVNKALVTQASAAIPVVPLYISILYRIMKDKKIHEGCIEQMTRLFLNHIGPHRQPVLDHETRIRLDDLEMREDVQSEIAKLWQQVNTDNLKQISDFDGYKHEFRNLFGFDVEGIDYNQPVEITENL